MNIYDMEFPSSFFDTSKIETSLDATEIDTSVKVLDSPFVIRVDTREQRPFEFKNIVGDYRDAYALINVRTVRKKVPVGDYSIEGMPSICIERKSHSDLFSSMHGDRARYNFIERIRRMNNEYRWSAVVIECSISDIHNVPLEHTSLNPLTVIRSSFSWAQQFPMVHWYWGESREMAEGITYRLLELFYRHEVELKYKHHNKPLDDNIDAFQAGQLSRMCVNEAEIPYPEGTPLRRSWLRGWGFACLNFAGGDQGKLYEAGSMPSSEEIKAKPARKRNSKKLVSDSKVIPLPGQISFLDPPKE